MGSSTIHVLHLASAGGAAARHAGRILATCRQLENHGGTREFRGSMAIIRRARDITNLSAEAISAGVDCHSIRRYGPCDPTLWFRLGKLIKRLSVDLVHTYDRESRFWALVLQPRFRFRMVAKAIEEEPHNWSERISQEIDHKLLPGFDRVIAANAQLARQLCGLGCRIGQIDVIPEEQAEVLSTKSIDAPARLRSQLVIPEQAPLVGLYLDGVDQDGAQRMAEAVRYAQGRLGPIYTLGIGPDVERPEIRRLLMRSGLGPRLRIYDIGDQLGEVSKAVDALIFAGTKAGPATLESQAAATPIIATNDTGAGAISTAKSSRMTITEQGVAEVGAALVQALGRKRLSTSVSSVAVHQPHRGSLDGEAMERLVSSYRRALLA